VTDKEVLAAAISI